MDKIKLILRFAWFLIKKVVQKIRDYKKIICIILIAVIALSAFFAIFDGVRVKNQKEPVFTIKKVYENPLKVEYVGLGYKVIRYPMVTELEPFENNLGVKFGTWFLKYDLEKIKVDGILFDIIDLTTVEMLPCDDVVETFYEDDQYLYQFPCAKSKYVLAHFKDGKEITVAEALKNGEITIKDLDDWNIQYTKSKK